MKPLVTFLLLGAAPVLGASFTEPTLVLYGRVLQGTGGTPQLLTAGDLTIRLRNVSDPANEVVLSTKLRPVGATQPAAYSYAVPVPMKHDVPAAERQAWIDVKGAGAQMRVVSITIDGSPATLASLDDDVLSVAQSQRADERRMDIFASGQAPDGDADGMPAWWENAHAFDDAVAADAGADADGDGLTNLEEYRLGTDPHAANDAPLLLTRSLTITREGTAGLGLRIIDSDTPPDQLQVTISSAPTSVELRKDGAALTMPAILTVAELEAGRVTLRHTAGAGGTLSLALNDGLHPTVAATVAVSVLEPSETAGVQALLWLDAHDVPANQPVAAWTDRSGRVGSNNLPRSLAQADPSRQPTASGGSAPAVVFGGNGAHLLASDASLAATTRAVFAWQAVEAAPTRQTVVQSNGLSWAAAPFDGPVGYPGAAELSIGNTRFSGFRTPGTASGLVAWRLTDEEGFALSDGLFDGTATADATARPAVLPALGARVRIDTTAPGQRRVEEPFSGRLHELLTYERALSERFAGQVEAYLLSRWQQTVVWDFGDSLEPLQLHGGAGTSMMIGGFGNDRLEASIGGGIVSGGPGDDTLVGGPGRDVFRWRTADSGDDTVENFDPARDRMDLSGRFVGMTGNLSSHVTLMPVVEVLAGDVRLTTRVELRRTPGSAAPDQTITLGGVALHQAELGRLAGEGVLVAGDLVPDETMSAAPVAAQIKEAPGRRLEVTMTRTGNTTHAEEVPLRFGGAAGLWRDFGLDGVAGTPARPTVAFARGASAARFFIVPAVDALDEGDESLTLDIVARPRNYTVAGGPAPVTLQRSTRLSVSSSGNVLASQGGAAGTLILQRGGDRTGALEITLSLGGDAIAGIDFQPLPTRVVMPDGASTLALAVTPLASAGPGVKRLVATVVESDAGYIPVAPWSAEFVIVPGDPLAAGGLAAWRAANDPGATSVPIEQYAAADRDGDGTSNFEEYLGTLGSLTYAPGTARDAFHVVLPRDVPDAVVTIERSADVREWAPLAGVSGTGVHFEAGRGYLRSFDRARPVLRPRDEFYRARAAYRNPVTALAGTPGLFAGAALPVAASGDVPWQASSQAEGGLVVGGLSSGGKSLVAASLTGPGTLGFEWFLSGAPGERLAVAVDGQEMTALGTGSGWVAASVPISAGEHRVTWTYQKETNNPAPGGSAGLRQVALTLP